MPRPPTVDPALVRDLVCREPRPSAAQIAQELSELLGRPINPTLVYSLIHRYRAQWDLAPPPRGGGSGPQMIYRHESDLPVGDEWPALRRMLACWERQHPPTEPARPEAQLSEFEYRVKVWGGRLQRDGRVVDVADGGVWHVRCAWPWEFGHLWRQPTPDPASQGLALRMALESTSLRTPGGVDVKITDLHREMWQEALDNEDA